MRRNASPIILSLCLVLLLAPSSFGGPKKDRATIEVVNESSWDIYHLYVSSSQSDDWGPDQLEEDILEPGESFLIYDIPCDDYDIMFVDEDGDRCILEQQTLCRGDSIWRITDEELLGCEWGTDD